MPTPSELIAQSLTKQTSVAAATESKQAALSAQDFYNVAAGQNNNAGLQTASPVEQDVRTLNLDQLWGKYGSGAMDLINGIATGSRDFQRDAYAQRSPQEAVADAVMGIGQGAVSSIGGIGALGLGLINDNAGAVASDLLGSFNEAVQEQQSPALAARRRANAARNAMGFRDNKALFEDDKEANGEFLASLSRIGRDASTAIGNATDDSTVLSDGISQGVGSLLAAGPVGRAVSAAGRAVVPQARQNALNLAAAINPTIANRAAASAVNLSERAAIPVAIGAMEGGGAFAETNRSVMEMTHDQLMAGSEEYRSLVAQGIPEQEAKTQVANRSALTAAGIQAPIAVATGTLVSRFEGSPLSAGSLRGVASNILRETAEEGIQSATGQTAQNVGQRAYSNSDLILSEGVGEQTGLGALYGAGTAGALQTPAAAKNLVKAGGRLALSGVGLAGSSLDKRIARLQEKNDAASPIGDVQMEAAATELNAGAETAVQAVQTQVESMEATPEEKTEANDLATQIVASTRLSQEDLAEFPPTIQDVFQDNPDRVTALKRLAVRFMESDNEQASMEALSVFYAVLEPIRDLQHTENALLNKLTGPAADAMTAYTKLIANIDNSTTLRKGIAFLDQVTNRIKPVTTDQLETPEGQAQVGAAIAVAALAPQKGNLAANEAILKHAEEGKIQLSPKRAAALRVSVAILRAQVAQSELLAKQGQETDVDIVAKGVLSDTKDPVNKNALSAWKHTQGVVQMMRAGRMGDAADLLENFRLFGEHMQNKLGAINLSLETEQPEKHQALNPKTKTWYESKEGYLVRQGSENSIRFAQRIGNEVDLLNQIYNGLTDAFPELGAPKLPPVSLVQQLQGKASDIALANRLNQQAQKRTLNTQPQPEQVEPETAAVGDRMVQEEQVLEEAVQEREAIQAEQPVVQEPVQEQTQEPEPVVVEPEVAVTPEPTVEEPVVEQDSPTSFRSLYPSLVNQVKNMLEASHAVPKKALTRIVGSGSPLAVVRDALSSIGDLTAYEMTAETIAAYRGALEGNAVEIMSSMNKRLQDFLNKPAKKGEKKTLAQAFAEGVEMNRWQLGKALNITEQEGDGFAYNQELQEAAVLAGIDWVLNAPQSESIMEDGDLEKISGMSVDDLSWEQQKAISSGMSLEQAKFALAAKIERYWGLKQDTSFDKAYTNGVSEAVAAEVLESMIDMGMVRLSEVTIGEGDQTKTIKRYIAERHPDEALYNAPEAIEQVVMIEPEERRFFGDKLPPVAATQMNNPDVPLTEKQKQAVANEQETPYYVDPHMVNFYTSLGIDNVLQLFGSTESDVMNKKHRISVEGQNQNFRSAFQQMQDLLADMSSRTDDVPSLPVRYQYGVSRVGRMQMLGKFNPQANKLMREAILPTWSTLDLTSNQKHKEAFGLATAQAFGIKVHNDGIAESIRKANEKLVALAPAVEIVNEWMGMTDLGRFSEATFQMTPVQAVALRTAFSNAKVGLTPHALHALVENVRLSREPSKDKFFTSLYLEADGVTNGPINAMMLMTTGEFDANWVRNVARGGVHFGGRYSLADFKKQANSQDLYQESTNNFQSFLSSLRADLDADTNSMMSNVLTFLDLFNDDVEFNEETGDLTLQRGIAKNPLTITLYGSGAKGIAGKLLTASLDVVYERMTAIAQSPENPAEAMFPGDPQAEYKFEQFQSTLETLVNFQVKRRWDKESESFVLYTAPSGVTFQRSPRKGESAADFYSRFSVNTKEMNVMTENMLEMFVKPLRQGVEATVGESLMKSVRTMRQATQAQSIVMQYTYERMLADALAAKKGTEGWKAGDFLSQQELNDLSKKMQDLFPLVRTEDQSFLIAKSRQAEQGKPGAVSYSRSLTGTMETNPNFYMPADASVSAIPFLTIGMGDGMMMHRLALQNLQGTLKVFDGMNMPLDRIDEYSVAANKSVYDSWTGNPLKAVHQSYNQFLSATSHEVTDAELLAMDQLFPVLFTAKELKMITEKGGMKIEYIRQRMGFFERRLQELVKQIDARHEVIRSMPMSVDHMASAAQPFTNHNTSFDAQPSVDDTVAELNKRLQAKLTAKPAEVATPVTPVAVQVLDERGVLKLIRSLDLNADQKKIYSEISRSLATKGYNIVVGSKADILAFDGTVLGADDNALTRPAAKTIYIANASAEVVVHELIHAASFEQVLSHYEGRTTPELSDAISRLEILMTEFMNMDDDSEGMQNARAAIQSAEADLGATESLAKAKALNEFMAWALTNQEITDMLTQQPVPALVRIAKDVLKAIKQLLWGKQRAEKMNDTFLTNLRFNTAIVIRSGKSLGASLRDVSLPHNTVFGSSDRLTNIRNAFATKVVDHIKAPTSYAQTSQQNAGAIAQAMAIELTKAVQAAGFRMTRQEASTFRLITHTLATTAEIDAPALGQAQALYTHVVKNLRVEDFMADPSSLDPAVRYDAQAKYDVLVGVTARKADAQGRSTMLPTFMALATVNDEFRAVLAKMDVPKSILKYNGTLDTALEVQASKAMDSMIRKVSGQGSAKNIQQAIDNLHQQIQDTVADDQQWFDIVGSKVGAFTDNINSRIVDGLQKLSDKGVNLGDNMMQSNNRYTRFAGGMVRTISGLATDENANRIAEGVVTMMNRGNLIHPIREFLSDLIGRTLNNADIYDMIKTTRATIQQLRQNFREEVPRTIASKFSRELTANEQDMLYRALARTDIAVLGSKAYDMLDDTARTAEILRLEGLLQAANPADWALLKAKAEQLAHFMNTGEANHNLLRNAHAVSNLWGTNKSRRFKQADVASVDQLVSLYALEGLNQQDRTALFDLVQAERDGMGFSLNYLIGQRKTEMQATVGADRALANHYKGYAPYENQTGVSLIVDDSASTVVERSFVSKGTYTGSSLDRWTKSKSYYFSPVSPRAGFNQGILQNVRHTASGVDQVTGFSMGMVAGRITDPGLVKIIARDFQNERPTSEPLMPIYDAAGDIVGFERSIDPAQMKLVQQPQHFMQQIGVWRGRQVEEVFSVEVNNQLIGAVKEMHRKDLQSSSFNKDQYIDLFNDKLDPVMADAVRLIPRQVREEIGDEFWVRKDMLNDVIGYRSATVGDAWTGNTRWNPETQNAVKKLAMAFGGNAAYAFMVNNEKRLQNFVGEARTIIVVKSVVVPMVNFMSNIFQLISRGVPVVEIARTLPNKLVEIEQYTKSRLRQVQLEAEIRGASNAVEERKLRAESRTIQDAHKRLSIWPLIEAGEFSSVADVNVTHEDVELTSGKLASYIEKQVDKLPDGLKTMGRYGLITRDTALFQGLQKSVQYGDFLAKAVMYDNLTKKKGLTREEALARITEEYVNYDRLAGRTRSYLESIGLMWFYNFKIRATKVGASILRNNPLHALLVGMSPIPDFFGSIGTPVDDNILMKAVEGGLSYSMGPMMGLQAPTLNPWVNLTS